MERCFWDSEVKPNQLSKEMLKDMPTLKMFGPMKTCLMERIRSTDMLNEQPSFDATPLITH